MIDRTGKTDVTEQLQAFLDAGGNLQDLLPGTYRLSRPLRTSHVGVLNVKDVTFEFEAPE